VIGDVLAAALPAAFLLDGQNLMAPFRRVIEPTDECSNDFTIMVPLYGHPWYLRNEHYLERYKPNVLLVINTISTLMAEFADGKEREGWRVARVPVGDRHSPAQMIIEGLKSVTTAYTIRMDGDTETAVHPGCAVAAMAADGADLCSVKVVPTSRRTLAEQMQGVEYDIAMLGRHNRPWLTSGACMIGKTPSYRQIMERHSLYFYGEDVETGRIAKYLGMRVEHIDFLVYTEVPTTFRALFQQRRGWWCGAFRTTVINADKNLRFPLWSLYYLVLVWALLAGKVSAVFTEATVLPTLILAYTALTVIANWPVRSRWMLVFPFYALAQAVVMPAFGLARYLTLLRTTRAHGRYRVRTFHTFSPRRAAGSHA
jgi:Glycosyl transferase family group 2